MTPSVVTHSPTPHPALQYTLTRDVVSSLRRHRMHEQQFTHPPLLVLNSFGPLGMHVKLMATMFQNLFPSINVHKVGRGTTQALGLTAQSSLPALRLSVRTPKVQSHLHCMSWDSL